MINLVRAAVLAAALLLASCNRQTNSLRKLNVVLVTLDTLRPDRLGCYGGKVPTPNLDRLARSGALWENAVTQAPLTAPSHASMFTALNPPRHKVRDTGGFVLHPDQTTLAEILQSQGWDTAAFVGAAVLKKQFGFDQGFSLYDDRMPVPDAAGPAPEFPERRASDVVDRAAAWLEQRPAKPYFLWVHLFDPHSPYDPPAPFREQYRASPYDGEVAYTDSQVGRLLDAVKRKSPDNTLVAVLSDHGESLGEHGEFTHGVFLYDSTLRIAFLLSGPGVPPGLRLRQQARTIDLLPTLLALMGGAPMTGMDGASLAPALAGKDGADREAYAESLYPKLNMGWVEMRAVRTSRWKFVQSPKPELYDLMRDPAETRNVIAEHPDQAKGLGARVKSLAGEAAEKVETAMVNRRTLEQLKSLGYLGGASQQQVVLTGQGIDPKDRLPVLELLHRAVSPDAGAPASEKLPALRQALALDPSNPTVYYHLGLALAAGGRDGEAMAVYREGIRRGIRTGWLYSRLASLHLRQGARDEAIVAFEQAAQLNPGDCESLSDLATAYLETGRVADAERVLEWSLATGEEHAPTHNALGLAAIQKRDMAAAQEHFEKAVALNPDLLEAQLNLGRIYKMIGANTRARACFEAFLAKAKPAEHGQLIPRIRDELKHLE